MAAASDAIRFLALPDGGHLAYRDAGVGPALVLLHGWGVSGRAFAPTLEALRERHRVIVPDLRGHGGSSPFSPAHRFACLADDVAALTSCLALDAPVIVGWSMGAMVAWDLAARCPDRAGAVVSIDMVPRLLSDAGWPHGLKEGTGPEAFARTMAAMRADWGAFTHIFVPRIFAAPPPASDPRLGLLYAAARANDGAVMARVWEAMAAQDLRSTLAAIDKPCLHLHGERSRLYGAAAARWVGEALRHGAVRGFEAAGHAPHLEAPGEFLGVLEEFTSTVAHAAAATTSVSGKSRNTNH